MPRIFQTNVLLVDFPQNIAILSFLENGRQKTTRTGTIASRLMQLGRSNS